MPPLNQLPSTLQRRAYWRSLAELAQSPQVLQGLEQEFSGYDPAELGKGLSRRYFLRVMSASLALAGLTLAGCRRWPEQEVCPQGSQPEGTAPGVPQYYATATEVGACSVGLLARSYDGRPIKIEGNPDHPFSLGAADARMQASLLELYDPDRSRRPLRKPNAAGADFAPSSWDEFHAVIEPHLAGLRAAGGEGLAVLTRPSTSPTLLRLRSELKSACPNAAWFCYEPIHRDGEIQGAELAFGKPLRPQYRLDQARVIACFDADLLSAHPAGLRQARDWAAGRSGADRAAVNRLYVAEPGFSLTGSVADHRLAVRSARVGAILEAVASQAGIIRSAPSTLGDAEHRFAVALAADLEANRGQSLVAVGPSQPAAVHALAHAVNDAFGNIGHSVTFIDEPLADVRCVASIRELAGRIRAGKVTTLLVLDGNPVYDAPADVRFAEALAEQPSLLALHLSLYFDETSARCQWHLPMAHFLECWGDGRAWDGTYGVQQPLIEPLFGGRSAIELLASVVGQRGASGHELVRQTARQMIGDLGFDRQWRQLLHDGLLSGSGAAAVSPGKPKLQAPASAPAEAATATEAFELVFVPSHGVWDGRHANNGWLQELPDPLTKLTWDNAALMSLTDAETLGLHTGDVVAIESQATGQSLEIAAYAMPGVARGTIVLPLGYGRTVAGRVGVGVGFDTYRLRGGDGYVSPAASVRRTGRTYSLAMTQDHHLIDAIGMAGRDQRVGGRRKSGHLIREATAAEFAENPKVFAGHTHSLKQLYDPPSKFNDPHAWGMAIDLDKCIGCAACVVACQAENNTPVVGKEHVAQTREMHWLRIDRYFKGPADDPDVVHAPVSCGHCENAPCEQVCPVAATVHDAEGLNTMVYNRCIGTRYCSNNCPVKVRRFNYFDFQSSDPRGKPAPWLGIPDEQSGSEIDPIKRMVFNPDVTVRMRGVMEKCTYCVQRIQGAKIAASVAHQRGERESDRVADGEVVTACQGACPTQAIVFGDLNDHGSAVSRAHAGPRAYEMLEELNLASRTKYLAKLRNPVEPLDAATPTPTPSSVEDHDRRG